MMIVKCIGGIGNQMFQMALCKSLLNHGIKASLDKKELQKYTKERNWEQAYILFGLDLPIVKTNRVKLKLYKLLNKYYIENENGDYDSNIFILKNGYIDGYWQSYKYFEGCDEMIRKMFSFPDSLNEGTTKAIEKIKNAKHSVSIHIRMGDYLEGINKEIYGGICTEEYYQRAISYFEDRYNDCTFFVFSNDKGYIKRFIGKKEFVIVDCNDEKDAWQDMYLMTQCNHNIIANSSFSWWGAWLNENQVKEVIAPKRWINTKKMKDICPPEWIRI